MQKAPNRQDNGYIQIAPVVLERTRVAKGMKPQAKPAPQNAHRLVVIAYKRYVQTPSSIGNYSLQSADNQCSQDDIDRLLAGQHASHRCSQSTCLNPDHIIVEPQPDNEGRKRCKLRGPVIIASHEEEEPVLPPRM